MFDCFIIQCFGMFVVHVVVARVVGTEEPVDMLLMVRGGIVGDGTRALGMIAVDVQTTGRGGWR